MIDIESTNLKPHTMLRYLRELPVIASIWRASIHVKANILPSGLPKRNQQPYQADMVEFEKYNSGWHPGDDWLPALTTIKTA